ncbi:hypothetical protein HJC23_003306 [Cyclotella cryptica]|uniref:Phytanoyl-CoA dioxygenase n=1 Tax=Cyclotella cryptica TaxID=29204 RepID=A0ABD3QXW0_9STRA|eukprot:CCRYP_000868-RB/>CCRYP_000868-RB protein AED:0.02 eAED:0.02 QI:304/1/1/1/1/1/3/1751/464
MHRRYPEMKPFNLLALYALAHATGTVGSRESSHILARHSDCFREALNRHEYSAGFVESNGVVTHLDHRNQRIPRRRKGHVASKQIELRALAESSSRSDPKRTSSKPRRQQQNLQMKRMKQSEIHDLVKGLGLEPVKPPLPAKKKRQQQMKNSEEQNGKPLLTESIPDIPLRTQLDYARKGHAVLRSFLPTNIIQSLRSELLPYVKSHELEAWRQKVEVQLADSSDSYYRQNARSIASTFKTVEECQDLIESLGLDAKDLPFLQHFNTWRAVNANAPTVRKLCLSPYLARSASILLDSPTVRLYQDSLFHKRPGDGWTPYHSDCRMAPFDTSKLITFWIPLQNVPEPECGGTGLLFVDGSHCDFALPYWNGVEGLEHDRLENRYYRDEDHDGVSHHMPLEVGDVTVHNGWTLHCADAADGTKEDRYALAITYVDGRAEVREDVLLGVERDGSAVQGDREDVWSFR